jgi:Rad3-related DNA helicase
LAYQVPANVWKWILEDKDYSYYLTEIEKYNYEERWKERRSKSESEWLTKEEMKIYNEITRENEKESKEERLHYMDAGCGCTMCQSKRLKALEALEKGVKKIERVIHDKEDVLIRAPKPVRKKKWFLLN